MIISQVSYRTNGPLVSQSEEKNSPNNFHMHCEIQTLLFEMVIILILKEIP